MRWIVIALLFAASWGCQSNPRSGSSKQETASSDDPRARFRCTGNEPGWNLTISSDSLVFVGDYGEVRAAYPWVEPRIGNGMWVYEYVNASVPGGFARLTVLIVRDSCSDGMSDKTYEYQARVMHQLKGYVGCATRL